VKLLSISLIVCVALLSLVVVCAHAAPSSWVDLRADSIMVGFSEAGLIEITIRYSVVNGMDHDELVTSEIGILFDGILVDTRPIEVTRSLNECRGFKTSAECDGDCYYSTVPPIQIGVCDWFYNYPPDTVRHEGCYCFAEKQAGPWGFPFFGQAVVSFVLDPGNAIWEPYEDNNSKSINLLPIATEPKSWSAIKAFFDED
jgi:hypothetical protein